MVAQAVWTAETQVDYTYDHLGRLNTARLVKRNGSTVSEQTSYTYNAVGSRAGMTLPNGVTTDYTYDALNCLTHIAHANSVDTIASYTYTLAADGKRTGLAEILDRPSPDEPEDNIIDYTYDNLSRITREYADANGTDDYYRIDYEYSIVGNRLKRIVNTGPQTLTTRCEYDPNTDQLIKELHNGPEVAFIWQNRRVYAYAPHGRITHYQIQGRPGSIGPFKASILGLPSVWSHYIFIAVMALLAVAFFAPALMSLPWKRKSSRPPTHLSIWRRCLCVLLAYVMLISPVGFETLARADTLYSSLETTDWHSGDRTIQYSYDDNGSVASKTTIETSDPNNVIETVTYEYNLQNRLKEVKVTTDGVNWDVTTYKYNDDGIRVEKNDNGTITQYVIDSYNHTGYAQVLEEWDTTSTPTLMKTYVIGDDVIGHADNSGTLKYYLHDGQGSVRHHSDASGNLVAYSGCDTFAYDAYGQRVDPLKDSINEGLFYTGEQWDNSAEQYYLRARYYNPLNGRFNRMDPFAGNQQDPQSLHKYAYAHCNPVNATDASGMWTYLGTIKVCTIIMTISNVIAGALPVVTGLVLGVIKGVSPGDYIQEFGKPRTWLLALIGLGAGALLGKALQTVAEKWCARWFPYIGAVLSLISVGYSAWMSYKMIKTAKQLSKEEIAMGLAILAASVLIMLALKSWWNRATKGGDQEVLRRYASSKENLNRLNRSCAASFENPNEAVKGLSVTAGHRTPGGAHGQATRAQVEACMGFKVHDTPQPGSWELAKHPPDMLHKTVEIPQPVTEGIRDMWNQLWGFTK